MVMGPLNLIFTSRTDLDSQFSALVSKSNPEVTIESMPQTPCSVSKLYVGVIHQHITPNQVTTFHGKRGINIIINEH